jgi:CHAT domain-containing protein
LLRSCYKLTALNIVYKTFGVVLFAFLSLIEACLSQCPSPQDQLVKLIAIEEDDTSVPEDKLKKLLILKQQFEQCGHEPDSVYARILHRMGLYEYFRNDDKPSDASIKYTLQAIRVNRSGSRKSSERFAIKSYTNTAIYYKALQLYTEALKYYDTAAMLAMRFPDQAAALLTIRYDKSNIYFHSGNYQQSIDESTAGLLESSNTGDSSRMLSFLNQKAQSLYYQHDLDRAIVDADRAIESASRLLHEAVASNSLNSPDDATKVFFYELSTAYKTKAFIYEQLEKDSLADTYFRKAISNRINSVINENFNQVAGDYNDYGNFLLNRVRDYKRANSSYWKTIEYAQKGNDPERMAKGYLNLGQSYFRQKQFDKADNYYAKSIATIGVKTVSASGAIPASGQLASIVNKEFVLVYLRNRLELLVQLYKNTSESTYLEKAIHTAYLNDTLINMLRHEQTAEQSKLYWRDFTRGSYSFSLEAAYLGNDIAAAFYFMEKSRAVLLNDKLNELGAFAFLPRQHALKEQQFRNQVTALHQNINNLGKNDRAYEQQQLQLLRANEAFIRYIRALEKDFPAYYQYKYSDHVPKITDLKKYLAVNNQSFVHYYVADSVTYILCTTRDTATMLRVPETAFKLSQVNQFLALLSDNQQLNKQYASFKLLSHNLYKSLFRPLGLTNGSVIICPDNFILPFDALSSDTEGKKPLIYTHAFSYVYSANFLLKKFPQFESQGDFIGFAPVSFKSYLRLADLKKSAASLESAGDNYQQPAFYTSAAATKNNFLSNLGKYHIVNVFSHAKADNSSEEPVLFMHDSVIRVSELQYLNRPSARLVVLSACQTTVGKNATGEGIYSLSRGFSAAGIPSVAATVWKADEHAIYIISNNFHKYLSTGMRQEQALQKAKIDYLKATSREGGLPYYWANMVLIGNTEPIIVKEKQRFWIQLLAVSAVVTLGCIMYFVFRTRD